MRRSSTALLPLLALSLLTGCVPSSRYLTPGPPASFFALGLTQGEVEALTDHDIRSLYERKPATTIPAVVGIAHLQGKEYRSYTSRGYGQGEFTLVSTREVETETDMQRLASMARVRALALLNRMVIPENISSLKELRYGAASVHADVLLIYTFDTRFETRTTIPFLGFLSLGLAPDENIKVTSTATAALIDVRTGYVYLLAENSERLSKLAAAWNSSSAIDSGRKLAESRAFAGLVDEIERGWAGVIERLEPTPP